LLDALGEDVVVVVVDDDDDPVVAHAEALAFSSHTLDRVPVPLRVWIFDLVCLCCVVRCRSRPCDEVVTRLRSSIVCPIDQESR
jgi:hypothetical protein